MGFKYQTTMKTLLRKHKEHDEKEFTTVYFKSTVKKVINFNKYGLDKSFWQLLYRLDNWINEGSAWTIEYMIGEYINISVYSSLSGRTYIELPDDLKSS